MIIALVLVIVALCVVCGYLALRVRRLRSTLAVTESLYCGQHQDSQRTAKLLVVASIAILAFYYLRARR